MFNVERRFIYVRRNEEKTEERREIIRGNLSYKFLWRGPILVESQSEEKQSKAFSKPCFFFSFTQLTMPRIFLILYSLITAFLLHATFSQHIFPTSRMEKEKSIILDVGEAEAGKSTTRLGRSKRERDFLACFLLYTFIDPVFWLKHRHEALTFRFSFSRSRSAQETKRAKPFDCFTSSSAVRFQHRSVDIQVLLAASSVNKVSSGRKIKEVFFIVFSLSLLFVCA